MGHGSTLSSNLTHSTTSWVELKRTGFMTRKSRDYGFKLVNPGPGGNRLFASAIIIPHGKLLGIQRCRTRPPKTSGYQPRLTKIRRKSASESNLFLMVQTTNGIHSQKSVYRVEIPHSTSFLGGDSLIYWPFYCQIRNIESVHVEFFSRKNRIRFPRFLVRE